MYTIHILLEILKIRNILKSLKLTKESSCFKCGLLITQNKSLLNVFFKVSQYQLITQYFLSYSPDKLSIKTTKGNNSKIIKKRVLILVQWTPFNDIYICMKLQVDISYTICSGQKCWTDGHHYRLLFVGRKTEENLMNTIEVLTMSST